MKFWQRIRGLFGISWGAGPDPSGYDSSLRWEQGLPIGNQSVLTEPYAQHPTVSKAIASVTEDAASIPWEVYPRGSERETEDQIEDHPIFDLWEKPNPFMSGN